MINAHRRSLLSNNLLSVVALSSLVLSCTSSSSHGSGSDASTSDASMSTADGGPTSHGGTTGHGGSTSTGGIHGGVAGTGHGGATGTSDAGNTPDASGDASTSDSGAGDAGAISQCSQPVVATWKADGQAFESQTSLFLSLGANAGFNLTLSACSAGDEVVQFEQIPMFAVGTYPLTFTILHGHTANGDGGGMYIAAGNVSYFTDANHTGVFKITSIDHNAKTFNGSFSFTGISDGDASARTVQITEGKLINIQFQ